MEERGQSNSTGQHKLILQNRKSGSFTGVTDVVNFDANEIIVVIYVFLFLILGLPVLGIEWIIAKFDKHAADISQLRMVQW